MKKIFFVLAIFVLLACSSKKISNTEDIPSKKAEILCKVDDRVLLFRSAYNYAFEDNVQDSIYRHLTRGYYYNIREKFNPLKNHDLVKFIESADYAGVDLPSIALCFEPETYKIKHNIDMDVLKFKFGKYYQHLDTLSVLLKDYHDKAEANQVIIPELDFDDLQQGFVEDKLDDKFKQFFKQKVKHRTILYLDPLNNYVASPVNFLKTNNFNNYLLVWYRTDINDDLVKVEEFDLTYAKYQQFILAGMIASVTEPLYIKYTDKQFESDLNNPKKHKSNYYPEELLNYAVIRKFKEYYKYPDPDAKSYMHQYISTFQDVYNLFAEYDPKNDSNFEKVYAKALKQLKTDFYTKINE